MDIRKNGRESAISPGRDFNKAGIAVLIYDPKIRGVGAFTSFKDVVVAFWLSFEFFDGRGVFKMKAGIEL